MTFNVAQIQKARLLRGMTRRQLSEKVGVDPSTIGRVERGEIQNPPTIKAIADALGLDMEELYIEQDEKAAV